MRVSILLFIFLSERALTTSLSRGVLVGVDPLLYQLLRNESD